MVDNPQSINLIRFDMESHFVFTPLKNSARGNFCAHNSNYIAKKSAPARDGFFMNMSVKLLTTCSARSRPGRLTTAR